MPPFPSLLLHLAPPARLISLLDPLMPLTVKRCLIEPLLNHAFAEPLREGEFDALEGRRITLAIDDFALELTLGLERQQLVLCDAAGEATIRGGWREFLCLATRREDPDSLFFQRRLSIEGDTELGLMVKNLLDGREEGLAAGPFGALLLRIESWVNRTR
ncbi:MULTISPECIES: SCP2 domain-containing protein [Halomonadaceae]|uniref:ubiquinone anaerobic biosynthesis accessory factor UbiT n=1 Tax=Halomonadaceae TaxID=28256 RepID=UPI001598D99F|nr:MULTISPECIES: SCP2 sterol-binding domain-containing protein [Halomonas]QJQ94857.1 sterol-binding protein [Halomonas sp. PA5]